MGGQSLQGIDTTDFGGNLERLFAGACIHMNVGS